MSADGKSHFDVGRAVLAAKLPPSAKLVLLALYDRQGQNGEAWPSLTRLCDDTALCRESVVQAIRVLKKQGLLTVEKPERPSVRACNKYTVQTDRLVRKIDQSRNQTSLENPLQLVRKIDSNVKENDPLTTPPYSPPKRSTPRRKAKTDTPPPTATVEGILRHWNTQAFGVVGKPGDNGHPVNVRWHEHRKVTPAIMAAVQDALSVGDYTADDVKAAISNYAATLKDPTTRWTYTWTLSDFLTRRAGTGKRATDQRKWWQFTPDEFDIAKYRRHDAKVEPPADPQEQATVQRTRARIEAEKRKRQQKEATP